MATANDKLNAVVKYKVSSRSQAQAAKTRMLLDKQLGEKTPAYIERLAQRAPLRG